MEEQDSKKITIWDDPDIIDSVIKSRLATFQRKGGKGNGGHVAKWTEDELELRDAVIWDYMTKQGLSREETARQISSRWGVILNTGRKYVTEAINHLANLYTEEEAQNAKKLFMERLESILQTCLEDHMTDTALRTLDLMGKAQGLYTEKKEVKVEADNIQFKFGE